MPPLENVAAITLEPSDDWIPPTPRGGGWGSSSSWTPKNATDEEWQREVGRRGEELIYLHEMERVKQLGYHESRVKWVAINNPTADYDILSVDDDGKDIWIEVKSTTGTDGRFQWSRAEFLRAVNKRDRYILWRVYEADTRKPRKKSFRDPVGRLINKQMRVDINNFNAMIESM